MFILSSTRSVRIPKPAAGKDRLPATQSDTRRPFVAACVVSCLLCAMFLSIALGVFSTDLRVPFIYEGDALFFLPIVKSIAQGDWIWYNSHLGMPLGADLRDFPLYTTVDAVVIKILSFAIHDPGLLINVFWLLAVTATAGTMTYSVRRLGATSSVAVFAGVVYALQPFTFYRGIAHLNLLFYLVPLLVTAIIEVALGRFAAKETDVGMQRIRKIRAALACIPLYAWIACVGQGLSYAYNSFFACLLLLTAAIIAAVTMRRWRAVVPGVVLTFVICVFTLINISPSLLYWSANGKNSAMSYKEPAQADVFGLKIRQLITPIPAHPLSAFRSVHQHIAAARFPNENENTTSRLGTIGTIGFLFLLGWALWACIAPKYPSPPSILIIGACAAMTMTCLLVATVGGFGSIFNVFVAPDIRAYNRISVFISCFSLVTIAVLLTRLHRWWALRHRHQGPFVALVLALTIVGVADQADTASYLNYENREGVIHTFHEDAAFVHQIDSLLPAGAMVFQLPFTDFPAEGPPGSMRIYDHARAYLHSSHLRWSWAGMSGRREGEWCRRIAQLPPDEMVQQLTAAGFSGLWIDLNGYSGAKSPETRFTTLLGGQPIRGRGGRILFYQLPRQAATKLQREAVLNPVYVTFPSGFSSVEEIYQGERWRWSDKTGTIRLQNTSNLVRTVTVRMALQTGYPKGQRLTIRGAGKTETLAVGHEKQSFTRQITVQPNSEETLSFDCDCQRVQAPTDPRSMYFRIFDFTVIDQ